MIPRLLSRGQNLKLSKIEFCSLVTENELKQNLVSLTKSK